MTIWVLAIIVYVIGGLLLVLGLARAAGDADDRTPGLRQYQDDAQMRAIRRHRDA